MADTQTAADFLRTFAAGILREGDPAETAARAREGLEHVLADQKSLVVDVQFTGFAQKGALVGGVDPRLLRAAGQLIMNRVSRVGFTADAAADDLAALFGVASRGPGELGGEGIMGALRTATPRGIYLSLSSGETYRPPAPPKPAQPETPAAEAVATAEETAPVTTVEEAPRAASAETPAEVEAAAEAPTPPPAEAATESEAPAPGEPAAPERELEPAPADAGAEKDVLGFELLGDEVNFNDFEILEAFPDVADHPDAPASAAAAPPPPRRDEPGEGDLFHFFRAAGPAAEPDPAQIPAMLHAAGAVGAFEEAAQAAARAANRQVAAGEHGRAVELLDTLVDEAQRPDRSRLFRDAAVGALRKVGSDGTLHYLVDLLQHGGPAARDRVLRVFAFIGGDALVLLEGLLFRTSDAEVRRAVFRALAGVEGMLPRLQSRAMSDPSPVRTRALLEIAAGELPAETALRWMGEAAAHPDPSVRSDAARHAAARGGRGGLRLLVELLNDTERPVRRTAIDALGGLGDPAAVPFLSRALNDTDDEELQAAAIAALGRTGSPEAVPVLLSVLNRRQLFGGKKLLRVKTAALAALSRIPTPGAREVLASVANGKDSDLAPEARRLLATMD